MNRFLLLLSFLFSIPAFTQKLIKGQVLDGEKNKPVPSASVFLNNTSIGTISDAQGRFELQVPSGKYDLIVSSVGYETFSRTIIGSELSDALTISLKLKAPELENIVIEPFEKDGWATWGKFFTENFIGTSALASDCRIKNYKTIRFRNSKKNNELTATAYDPLIIENKALGYTIRYQLESFRYDFKTHYLVFTGYPYFEPMKGSEGRQKKWQKKREEAYKGSMMHFMRSLFRNQLLQQGFEVRALNKVENTEKKRVRSVYSSNSRSIRNANGTLTISTINADTAAYYSKILSQEDFHDVIGREILPGDSIAYAVNESTAGFEFSNYLLVIYKNKIAPPEYQRDFPKSSTAMMSQLTLINKVPVEVQSNGSYYNPEDLLSLGYWAWSEKIAAMLPFDYELTKGQ